MKIEFREFMSKLDGMEYNDRALIDNMFYQCDRLARESKRGVLVKVSKHHDRVCLDGVEGYDNFNVLSIYYTVNGKFFVDEFATKPVYPSHRKDEFGREVCMYSEYRHQKFVDKREMLEYLAWDKEQTRANEYAKGNYYLDGDDEKKEVKMLVDGFFDTWNHVAPEIA